MLIFTSQSITHAPWTLYLITYPLYFIPYTLHLLPFTLIFVPISFRLSPFAFHLTPFLIPVINRLGEQVLFQGQFPQPVFPQQTLVFI